MQKIVMRYPGGKPKALTLSYDDAVEQDEILVGKMIDKGIKGTFNINTGLFEEDGTVFEEGTIHRRMSKKATYELFKDSGMEVAVHCLTHPFLEQLPATTALYEVLEDRKNIEDMFGTVTQGMAYPYGTYSDTVVEMLKAAGIKYSRTIETHRDFCQPEDWLRLKATCHHNDSKLMELAEKFVADKDYEDIRKPYLFYLWGHSYEFERDNNWEVIDNFFDVVSGKDDIWYATNIEIYNYTKAFESLEFTVDGKRVYNPSSTSVWIGHNDETFEIKSGEEVYFWRE